MEGFWSGFKVLFHDLGGVYYGFNLRIIYEALYLFCVGLIICVLYILFYFLRSQTCLHLFFSKCFISFLFLTVLSDVYIFSFFFFLFIFSFFLFLLLSWRFHKV